MGEQLTKLRPDRDLQCYFQRPSAIAALSGCGPSGFTVSGCWREQFDWAVVEWNRDNVFEHPALRNLPDGDLSGIHLTYVERRTNCITLDSTLYPTVEWPYLRIWAEADGRENLYLVPLRDVDRPHAVPADGEFSSATVTFELLGAITGGDYIELSWLDQHFNHYCLGTDTLESAVLDLAQAINQFGDGTVEAIPVGRRITLAYAAKAGMNGNRIGAYGTVHGAGTEQWAPGWGMFTGGTSPRTWRVDLDFATLRGYVDPDRTQLVDVPTSRVRKMRWTWAADLQPLAFERSEFSVEISEWSVTGNNLGYRTPGPGSRRIEDRNESVEYSPDNCWMEGKGNFSQGSIHWSTTPQSAVQCAYEAGSAHSLYLGTRRTSNGAKIAVQVDADPPKLFDLALAKEDVLVRLVLAEFPAAGSHTVRVSHEGPAGADLYFDYLELALPSTELPAFPIQPTTTLATDWDTDHSIALAPERTAWIMHKLGFHGRANHYVGALWFYELCRPGQQYASATVTFAGCPEWGKVTAVTLGETAISHVNLIGDTAESVAQCFSLLINAGSNNVWARAEGAVLTVTARQPGTAGNGLPVGAATDNSPFNEVPFAATADQAALTGGIDGYFADPNQNYWRTDLNAEPRINRAARDWSRCFFGALKGYGIDGAAAFSLELQHGDDSPSAGIAQRYPNGNPAWLTTPALQTNFGPASRAFWQQVHRDMASVMSEAGVVPYLQFGEVQWWYFPGPTATLAAEPGLPLYDDFTTSTFRARYGRSMSVIPNQYASPADFPDEVEFLPSLIGDFTMKIQEFVRLTFPDARFEVLYPPDVNDTPLNRLINFPDEDWTPENLTCLKTENFTYTFERDVSKIADSIRLPSQKGFAPAQYSHLIGIGDYSTPWLKEHQLTSGVLESVVLFALDQFCLIGYSIPLRPRGRRSRFMGA